MTLVNKEKWKYFQSKYLKQIIFKSESTLTYQAKVKHGNEMTSTTNWKQMKLIQPAHCPVIIYCIIHHKTIHKRAITMTKCDFQLQHLWFQFCSSNGHQESLPQILLKHHKWNHSTFRSTIAHQMAVFVILSNSLVASWPHHEANYLPCETELGLLCRL